MTIQQLLSIAADNGLSLSAEQVAQLEHYGEYLREWNRKVNLISRKDEENVYSRHILHSLSLAVDGPWHVALAASPAVLDLGTGGGLPGIPLAIARPDFRMTLVDSIQKKIAAVKDMVGRLGLGNATTQVARVESLATDRAYLAKFDLVVTRAVAPIDELVGWTERLVKPGATLLALKGGDLTEEIERGRRARNVKRIDAYPLALAGYEEYLKEGKQIVTIEYR